MRRSFATICALVLIGLAVESCVGAAPFPLKPRPGERVDFTQAEAGNATEIKILCSNGVDCDGNEVGQMVVRGEAEFGVLPVSEILPVRGAELLGTFPDGTDSYVLMVAGVSSSAKQGNTARDLIGFLKAPAALPVIKAKGMEPDGDGRR